MVSNSSVAAPAWQPNGSVSIESIIIQQTWNQMYATLGDFFQILSLCLIVYNPMVNFHLTLPEQSTGQIMNVH
jgi:hypothetical protein